MEKERERKRERETGRRAEQARQEKGKRGFKKLMRGGRVFAGNDGPM